MWKKITWTFVPKVTRPTNAFWGSRLNDMTRLSFKASRSSSSIHKSIAYKNTGGTVAWRCKTLVIQKVEAETCHTGRVYSTVVN